MEFENPNQEISAESMEDRKGKIFAEQWGHPEILTLSGGKVEVYDITPERQKTEVPVVFMPGWGGTSEMYRKNMEVFAVSERRALSVDAPHGVKHKIDGEDARDIPDAELRKIAALIESLDVKGIQKVDAIGHSEGGIDIVLAAKLYPDRFRNIVLVDPGGMIGEDNSWKLATRFSLDVMKSYVDLVRNKELREPMFRSSREVTMSSLKNPVRAFKEIRSIASTQIQESLRELKRKGIGISIIHGVDDAVFPMGRVQRITKKDMVDGFYSVKGRHAQFQLKADSYTRLAESALTAMERKQQMVKDKGDTTIPPS